MHKGDIRLYSVRLDELLVKGLKPLSPRAPPPYCQTGHSTNYTEGYLAFITRPHLISFRLRQLARGDEYSLPSN